jgi:hypothetical protein
VDVRDSELILPASLRKWKKANQANLKRPPTARWGFQSPVDDLRMSIPRLEAAFLTFVRYTHISGTYRQVGGYDEPLGAF